MDLLILTPFGRTEPEAYGNLESVSREDVNLTIENIADVFPLSYNTYEYNVVKSVNGAMEHIIASADDYDGVMVSCNADPGVHQARSVVDIPVIGSMQGACIVANLMGRRFSVVQTDRQSSELLRRTIESHGFGENLASYRWIDIIARDLWDASIEEIRDRTIEQARKCVIEDNAEVIIPGCTIQGAILTKHSSEIFEDFDVPIVDPMIAGLKVLEMMVDLVHLAGYPAVSRIGRYRKHPQQELDQLQQWLRSHESPEHHYIEQKALDYDHLFSSFVDGVTVDDLAD